MTPADLRAALALATMAALSGRTTQDRVAPMPAPHAHDPGDPAIAARYQAERRSRKAANFTKRQGREVARG